MAERAERLERLRKLIEEDEEILRHVREVAETCCFRRTQLSCQMQSSNSSTDAVRYMIYHMAERDLEDLETMIAAEKWNSENDLKKLEEGE